MDQELLLGYLMNALDAEETADIERRLSRQPKLRSELAKLQKIISPLDVLFASADPPEMLAKRTCDNIWSATQNQEFSDNLKIYSIANKNCKQNAQKKSMDNLTIQSHFLPANNADNLSVTNLSKTELPETELSKTKSITTELNKTELIETDEIDNEEIGTESLAAKLIETDEIETDEIGTELIKDELIKNELIETKLPESELIESKLPETKCAEVDLTNSVSYKLVPRRASRRRTHSISEPKQKTKKNLWRQLAISAVIGIVLAVVIYPLINMAVVRITQVVVQGKVRQLDQSVEVYAQLQSGSPAQTNPNEINLARYGWQEFDPSGERIFLTPNARQFAITDTLPNRHVANHALTNTQQNSTQHKITPAKIGSNLSTNYAIDYGVGNELLPDIFRGQSPATDNNLTSPKLPEFEFFDVAKMVQQEMFSNSSQPILVLDGSEIKPAVGQIILIQNGKIFFRSLPQSK
ncbi:MAG: hypothetical protein LBQ66_00140 [Planctomycetaceae bacterium]|jgi:anti-sigma-K factor RskA|nr:hypothetical protein [Planctomycetaceae bacterium]